MIMMLTMIMTVIAAFMGCPGDSGVAHKALRGVGISTPVFNMEKLRLRENRRPAQGHTGRE